MKLNFKKIILLFLLVFVVSCKAKEIDIIEKLNEKLIACKGNVTLAKETLEQFLKENEAEIVKLNEKLTKLSPTEKKDRFLEFNRAYYNKKGLFETLDKYKYLQEKEFETLFETFKQKMGPFFKEEF